MPNLNTKRIYIIKNGVQSVEPLHIEGSIDCTEKEIAYFLGSGILKKDYQGKYWIPKEDYLNYKIPGRKEELDVQYRIRNILHILDQNTYFYKKYNFINEYV